VASACSLAETDADVAEVLTLSAERMGYGPEAVAHAADGKTVFVSGAVPGDTVAAELTEDGPRFSRARTVEVVEPSADRVVPECPYATLCGGCPWAALSYPRQAIEKRQNVVSSLVRLGHFPADEAEHLVAQTVTPGKPWGYRNKVELAVGTTNGRLTLGMHAAASDSVVKVKECKLLQKKFQGSVKSVSGAMGYLANSHGLQLERVGIRASARTNELEVALWGPSGPFPRAQVAKVLADSTKMTSLVRVMQKGPAKARKIAGVERLSGKGSWGERIGSETMRVSAPSFFQVNTAGAEKIVELVLEGLAPDDDDEAMDLYCGAGTFTIPLARRVGFVSAVESYGPAVRDLRRNLESARLDNVDAVGGDAGREFPDTDADIIVVDPPRAGLAADVVRQLSEQPARAIAYVSCDPATLARDLARFREAGTFKPVSVTPVDLFPQTFHVEDVCILRRA
jgi:23S rRNA (uracil1939-C5)-methyltransferase